MGRQRKSKVEKCPFKMRLKTLADGRQSIMLDRYADGKYHYEHLQLYLLPETTAKLLGHSKVTTTQIYAKIVDSKKVEAVNLVEKVFD